MPKYARATRHTPGRMNALEARYAERLELERKTVLGQALAFGTLTLKLAADTRYTPDFWCVAADGTLECHEVKGFLRDDAWVKLKVAAAQFPFRFRLVRWHLKQWTIEEVTP